jgi:hypothetical protein
MGPHPPPDHMAQEPASVTSPKHPFTNSGGPELTKDVTPPANTKFCPDDVVTRGQMAAFLKQALEWRRP